MSSSGKRSASPLPRHFDEIRKIRIDNGKEKHQDKDRLSVSAPMESVQRGQEVLSLSPSMQQELGHGNLNDLILQTTTRLAEEGRRLLRAPQLLPDGIGFDWVADDTARHADMKSLLSVEGIRAEDLKRVLHRATPVPGGSSRSIPKRTSAPSCSSLTLSPANNLTHNLSLRHNSIVGSASDPIVIDDDEDIEYTALPSHSGQHSTDDDITASRTDVATGQEPSGAFQESLPSCSSVIRSHALQQTVSQDRPAVVSHATRCSETPLFANTDQDEYVGMPDRLATSDHGSPPDYHLRLSHNTPDYPNSEGTAELNSRMTDYGQWKAFAEDSSEDELTSASPSSREASIVRTLPPQSSAHLVAGQHFVPHTHDTSDLLAHFPSTEVPGSLQAEPSWSQDGEGSTLHPMPTFHRRRSYHTPNRGGESSSSQLSVGGGSLHSRTSRSQTGLEQTYHGGDHAASESSSANSGGHPLTQSSPPPRNLRKIHANGLARAATGNNHTSEYRQPHSPGRSASCSHSDVDTNTHATVSLIRSGHTVVIPKSVYARGRRLLAPSNVDKPLTTIAMRGDAHFVDQRRKTRVSQYSLPTDDDRRHVEDACLVGDDMVVVGYNKGPCQVSLIPVEADQRPYRIDIKYRAHSTVIENPATGKSYANRGISCLAPVTHDSFLSGGYDKKVHHWKLERVNRHRSKARVEFSASSTRIPTAHTQHVQALAYCAWNDTVYSTAGDRIATTTLAALTHNEPERVSGKVTQMHVHPQDPRLVAIEIDHLDYQVLLYDMRQGGFNHRPWLEFGYRAAAPTAKRTMKMTTTATTIGANGSGGASPSASSSSAPKTGSSYTRGSTTNSLFARGYGDGVVLVWDYRNGAQKKVLERFQFHREAEVAHTVLAGSDVIAYGGCLVTFWSVLCATA